jgi:hypothetical protein
LPKIKAHNKPILIWQLTDRGFASEINAMILAVLYCMDRDYHFMLYSKTSNISCCHGWRDYFLPFCDEIDHFALRRAHLFSRKGFRHRMVLAIEKAKLRFSLPRPFFLMTEKWNEICNGSFTDQRFSIAGRINVDCHTACQSILHSIWRFNPETNQAVSGLTAQFADDSTSYCSIHIRRGDKIKEAPHTAVQDYLEKIRAVNPNLKKVFVMTDDYTVVDELKNGRSDLSFHSLCPPNRQGHLQKIFNKAPKETRRAEILRLLAELEMARNGEFFVGTYSSNITRLISLLRGRETTYSVDIPHVMVY